jgi:hypothetical protein
MCFRFLNVVCVTVLCSFANSPVRGEERAAEKPDVPDLYRIWVEKKIGFIDRSGRVVIQPQFNWAYDFSEGLAQANVVGKEGYIDRTGNWAFEIDTHDDRPFRCGVAVVCTGKRTGIVDRTGQVIDCPFDWMNEFTEGLAGVAVYEKTDVTKTAETQFLGFRPRKWGFVDSAGKLVIPVKFTAVGSFSAGLAPVYLGGREEMCTGLHGGKWGYINREGELVIKPQFNSAGNFSEGLAVVSFDGKNYGWIDKGGKFAIKMRRLTIAMPFHDGVAWIRGAPDSLPGWNDFGYIAKDGNVFVHPAFRASIGPFSEGLAEAREPATWNAEKSDWTQGKYGYVDKRGKWVIEPQFTHTRPFRSGLASVQKDEKMAYIDVTGRVVWSADRATSPK